MPVTPGGNFESGPDLHLFCIYLTLRSGFTGSCGRTDRGGKSLRGATASRLDSGSWGEEEGGATRLRLGEAATLCSCLLCAAKPCPPAALGGDLGKPSPPSWVERSRGIPDIFRLFVFHPEDSQCSWGCCYKGSPYLFEVHITPEHAPPLSDATKNPL